MNFDPERGPTLSPYPALLATGALMFATVLIGEGRPGIVLAWSGAKSLNRDVAALTVRARTVAQQFAVAHFGQRRPQAATEALPQLMRASLRKGPLSCRPRRRRRP
jgi:hypothetical protein